jgi:ribosomal protein L35AE/L33A
MEQNTEANLDQVLLELKNLNDNYEARLNISGMNVYKTKEDGNCLFRALSVLYFGDEQYHFILR